MRLGLPRFFFPATLALLCIDQASKFLAFSRPVPEPNSFFSLIHFYNHGLVFSIAAPLWLSISLSLIALGVLIWYCFYTILRPVQWLGLSFLLSGALGNLLDRGFLGYVRDWMLLAGRSAFNLADVFILAGLLLLFFIDIAPTLTQAKRS